MFGLDKIVDNLIDGIAPDDDMSVKDQIKSLAKAGVSIAVIATMFGLAEDVVESITEKDE